MLRAVMFGVVGLVAGWAGFFVLMPLWVTEIADRQSLLTLTSTGAVLGAIIGALIGIVVNLRVSLHDTERQLKVWENSIPAVEESATPSTQFKPGPPRR